MMLAAADLDSSVYNPSCHPAASRKHRSDKAVVLRFLERVSGYTVTKTSAP